MTVHETLTFDQPEPMTAETGRRLITGLVVPFDTYGMTSAGRVRVRRDAIQLPADLSRVKLMNRHTNDQRAAAIPVGVAVRANYTDDGLVMTFKVADGPDGDRTLAEAQNKTNDGLSIETVRTDIHGDEMIAGDLTVVAVVPVPAYSDARVTEVAASSHEPAVSAAATEHAHNFTPTEHTAQPHDHEPNREESTMTEAPAAPSEPTAPAEPAAPSEPTAPAEPAAPSESPTTSPADDSMTAAAVVPMFRGTSRREPGQALDQLFAAVSAVNAGHLSPELTAALSDITYSAGPFAAQPEYVGELWSGVPYERKFVPLLNQRPLKSLKVKGWFWVTAPEVADYAGDKAAIPSNAVEVDDREITATRLAGGHDIDRAYYDFGDREFIEAYYRQMALSYAKKSDAKALADIIAASGAASGTVGTDLLDAVAIGVDEIDQAEAGTATFALVNNVDRRGLLSIGANDLPAYLKEILKIDPRNFVASATIPAGTVVVGVKSAMDHLELPGSPIRVSAVNVPNGGVDDAVFGYRATMLQEADGLAKVTFA